MENSQIHSKLANIVAQSECPSRFFHKSKNYAMLLKYFDKAYHNTRSQLNKAYKVNPY